MDTPSIAVVGTNIGCKLHVPALRAAGFEVATLVGRDPVQTEARAREWGIPRAATFAEAMDSSVDAVLVASPPEIHHQQTMAALAAGKHVLCEKPFAVDVGQAREMRDAAVESGLAHAVVHPQRWFTSYALARKALRAGMIGELLQARFEFDHSLLFDGVDTVPEWWNSAARGGGWIRNYNSHGVDAARFMLGEIAAVCATSHADAGRGFTADDSYVVSVVLAGGGQGVMAGSCRSKVFNNASRLIGKDGVLRFDWSALAIDDTRGHRSLGAGDELISDEDNPGRLLRDAWDEAAGAAPSPGFGSGEQTLLSRAFHRRIVDRAFRHPAMADFEDGLRHMQIIDAIERSVRERCWIDIPPPDA